MHPDPSLLGAAVRLSLSSIALFAAIRFIVEPTLNEGARQRLFRLRRDLFLYMAAGGIEPDSPAYTTLRMTINGALRFAERMTLPRAIYLTVFFGRHLAGYRERMEQILATLSPSQKKAIEEFRTRLGLTIALHMLVGNVVAWIITIPILVVVVATALVRTLARRSYKALWSVIRDAIRAVPTEVLEADAESMGDDRAVTA